LHPAAALINIDNDIWKLYFNVLLPMFVASGDDGNYAQTAAADLTLLQVKFPVEMCFMSKLKSDVMQYNIYNIKAVSNFILANVFLYSPTREFRVGRELPHHSFCSIKYLQVISRRIHRGKFVAEAKFRETPQSYEPLIRAKVCI